MTDYTSSLEKAGVFNPREVVRALEQDLPFRTVNTVKQTTRQVTSTNWTNLQTLTIDLSKDDAATVFFDVVLYEGGTGDFDFRLVYGQAETALSCTYEVAKYSSERFCFSGRGTIENQVGALQVTLQGKVSAGPEYILTQITQMKAMIFKKKSQPESFPIEGVTPVLWLEGDDLLTIDSSYLASAWDDKSASAIEAAQATAGNRPLVTGRDKYENFIKYSEDLSDSSWTKTQCTISANATTAPDGETTADKVVESSNNALHYFYQDISSTITFITGVTYRASGYFKAAGRYRGYFYLDDTAGFPLGGVTFNLSTVTLPSKNAGVTNETIEDVGDGWYRISFDLASDANGVGRLQCEVRDNSGNGTYTGDGSSGFYAWGMQVQRASVDSTYKKTTSHPHEKGIGGHRAISFRQADKMTLTGNPAALKISGDITFFFVLEKRTSTGAGSDETIINCLTGSATGYLIYYDNNDGQLHYSTANGSVATADSTTGLLALDTPTVVTIQKIGTTANFYKNGVAWGSGTVSNPSNQTYFDICQSNRHLLLGAAIIVGGTMAASTRQAIEAMLIKDYLRDPEISSLKLSAEWLQDYISSFAGKVFEEVWTGSSTLSSTGNVIDSIEVQLEDDEIAIIFADLGYKTSSTSTGNCDVYINIDGVLYGEKHGLEYGYDGGASKVRKYRASLMAKKTDGNGGLVTIELKHDAVSGNNITVTESQLLVLVLKKRV